MLTNIRFFQDKQDLEHMSTREVKACEEEWFDNIAAIIFGIKDISNEEEELIKALDDKYDAVRDKLLLEALMKQMGEAEWAKLSAQEAQARLTRIKLMERRLRRDGQFDEAAALLGDAMKNADLLQVDFLVLLAAVNKPGEFVLLFNVHSNLNALLFLYI